MKISEVSKIFDIPQETLRYIEQRGLVHPVRNKENGYREYDLPAFSELFEYMRFRNMGLSVHSVSQIYQNGTLDTMCNEVRERQKMLEKEIAYASLLKTYLDEFLLQVENLQDNIGLFRFVRCAPFLHVCVGSGARDQYEYIDSQTATQWRKFAPFVTLGYRFDEEQLEGDLWKTQWAFLVNEAHTKALNMHMDDRVELDQGGICLSGYIAYSTWQEARTACREAAAFARAHGYDTNGVSTVIIVMQRFTDDGIYDIAQLNMPVKKL